jgi:hypothetical protein
MPVVVEYICEQAAKRSRGPLTEPARTTVLDGLDALTPASAEETPRPTADEPESPVAGPVFTDPRDAEQCAAESRLVRELLDGTPDRPRYQAEMAALAADTASPPVRLPGDPGERPV